VALWITATTGSAAQKAPVPIWILLLGGLGISAGLWIMGRRVMKTLGEDLTKITPSRYRGVFKSLMTKAHITFLGQASKIPLARSHL